MGKIILSADSTCDMQAELVKQYDIRIIPLTIILGDKDYTDGIDVTPEHIYQYVSRTGILPKTSATSAYTFSQAFESYLSEPDVDAIIHFSISSHLSAAYQNALLASKEFKNVHVINTEALSTGTALMLLKTQDMIDSGMTLSDIVLKLKELPACIQTSFFVDKLDYLYKGGRCNGLTLLGANMLKIHPMLQMQNGYLKVATKFMGSLSKVSGNYLDYLQKQCPTPDLARCYLTQTEYDPAVIESMTKRIQELFGFKEILHSFAGSTITSHCGKGTVGLLFINDTPVLKEKNTAE